MSERPWNKPPTWDGEYVEVDLKEKYLSFVPSPLGNIPFCIQLDGSEDAFLPMFSTEEGLRKTMDHLEKKLGFPSFYIIGKIDDAEELVDGVIKEGCRVMLDPQIISDTHTKWHEPVKHGDVWKYANPEKN